MLLTSGFYIYKHCQKTTMAGVFMSVANLWFQKGGSQIEFDAFLPSNLTSGGNNFKVNRPNFALCKQ